MFGELRNVARHKRIPGKKLNHTGIVCAAGFKKWLVVIVCGGAQSSSHFVRRATKVARRNCLCGGLRAPRILLGVLKKWLVVIVCVGGSGLLACILLGVLTKWLVVIVCVGGSGLLAFCSAYLQSGSS